MGLQVATTSRHTDRIAFALLLLFAAAIRLVALDRQPLWIDEANSLLIAWRGLTGMTEALSVDGNPPLFYVLLGIWTSALGSGEAAARALPACIGVACVAATFWGARELLPGRRFAALFAAAVVALGPLSVALSRTVRMYTLTPLIALTAVLCLDRALRSPPGATRTRWWAAHAGLLAMGLYAHNYFLFVLPLGIVLAWLAPGAQGRRRALFVAGAAIGVAGLAYLPWVPVLLGQMGSGVSAWIRPFFESTPPVAAIPRSFEVMGVGASFPGYLGPLSRLSDGIPGDALWIAVRVAGASLTAFLLWFAVFRGREDEARPESVGILGALLVLPLLLPWLVSLVWQPVYLGGRYEVVASTAFALLVGRGIDVLWQERPAVAAAAAAAWCGLAILSLLAYFAVPVDDGERQAAAWIRANARPGDVFVFPGYSRAVPEYYLRVAGFEGERVSFPASVGRHMGWFDAEHAVREADATRREAERLADRLGQGVDAGGRVLLLDVDSVARRAGVTGLLRSALRARTGGEEAIPSTRPRAPPPVYLYSNTR